jgi:hypothetical protein
MHSRRKTEIAVIAIWVVFAWYFFSHLGAFFERPTTSDGTSNQWRYEAKELVDDQKVLEPSVTEGAQDVSETASESSSASVVEEVSGATTSIPALPDRVVVMAKLPEDDTSWVETDLLDWQSAIYHIDIEHPHNTSTLDPITNDTLRTLRNKGMEANAYLAYIVQNYDSLPSTIAFIHPHKDGYPLAWHTDNYEHSNVVSLQTLNIDFIQRNGYANLRCIHDPGCPHEVMPFRDPPEEHRTIEAAMPDAWRDLFNNTNVPQILATPCCAQFAVSSEQVRKRPLEEYRKYYRWLMETELKDETSGRVFEYLWHILFGKEPV